MKKPSADLRPTFARIKDALQLDRYPAVGRPDLESLFIMLSTLLLLNVFWYFGRNDFFNKHLAAFFGPGEYAGLYPFVYFSLSSFVCRTLIPLLLIYTVLRKRPGNFGYKLLGTFDLWYLYLLLFLVVLPLVYLAGYSTGFQSTYPLSKSVITTGQVNVTKFLIYQAFYGLIFISGESFWRGYLLFGLERKFGYYAIFIMLFPYVMTHYGKPFPEVMAAILAGTALGYLALRHRSFWLGVITHWGVAVWMDLVALHFRGVRWG